MSRSAKLKPSPFWEHRSPFGAPQADEPARMPSIADAVGHCHGIARDIDATAFGLFLVNASADLGRLLPCFDSDHPRVSPLSRHLSVGDSEAIVRHARTSTLPCWWGHDDAPPVAAFSLLPMARRVPDLSPDSPGIAFPVSAERGQCGLFVFLGPAIAIDEDLCLDVHSRCFALFAAAMLLKPGNTAKTPTISKRELECLRLSANGMTSEQIATALKLSVHTTNQYLSNSTQKLDAANRTHAVAKALKLGLFE